jgi:hypothetical protein
MKYKISKTKPYSLVTLHGTLDLNTIRILRQDLMSDSLHDVHILDFKDVKRVEPEAFHDFAGLQVVLRKKSFSRLFLTNMKLELKKSLLQQGIIRSEESAFNLVEVIKKVS